MLSEATERVQAECILFASDDDELYDTLRVLQRISEYQDVSVKKCTIGNVHIIKDAQNDPVSNERELCKLFIDTFRINRFATDVHVEDCGLPSQVIKHLIDQLRGCNDLTKLVLSKLLRYRSRCQDDIFPRIELIPSFVLSSDNTNCKNDIQLFHQLFDELSVHTDYH